ncbi:MAG: hypothetical protein HC787_09370 [Nostocaceae cyanobacterium CSU_2_110]|nr:hypothetical protein [Nostocaceae cyanobacterium CSU_2_110]
MGSNFLPSDTGDAEVFYKADDHERMHFFQKDHDTGEDIEIILDDACHIYIFRKFFLICFV